MNTVDEIRDALSAKLDELDIENVFIEDVEYDIENEVITVEFCDESNDCVTVQFGFDENELPYALVIADEDNDSIVIDLSPLNPTVDEGDTHTYFLDLVDTDWLNFSTFKTILTAGNIMANESNIPEMTEMTEVLYQKVVRTNAAGKQVVVKIPVRLRKKKLTPKQKAALVKARKKSNTGAAMKRRAKSLTVRKVKNMDK